MIRNNLTGLMITRQHTFKNHESLRARCIKLRPSIFSVVTKTRNHPKPPKTTQNHPKPPKTTQNHPKPPKTTQNHLQNQQNQPKRFKTSYK